MFSRAIDRISVSRADLVDLWTLYTGTMYSCRVERAFDTFAEIVIFKIGDKVLDAESSADIIEMMMRVLNAVWKQYFIFGMVAYSHGNGVSVVHDGSPKEGDADTERVGLPTVVHDSQNLTFFVTVDNPSDVRAVHGGASGAKTEFGNTEAEKEYEVYVMYHQPYVSIGKTGRELKLVAPASSIVVLSKCLHARMLTCLEHASGTGRHVMLQKREAPHITSDQFMHTGLGDVSGDELADKAKKLAAEMEEYEKRWADTKEGGNANTVLTVPSGYEFSVIPTVGVVDPYAELDKFDSHIERIVPSDVARSATSQARAATELLLESLRYKKFIMQSAVSIVGCFNSMMRKSALHSDSALIQAEVCDSMAELAFSMDTRLPQQL